MYISDKSSEMVYKVILLNTYYNEVSDSELNSAYMLYYEAMKL